MKTLNIISIATISVLALSACGEEEVKVRNTQYYTDNPSEIKKVQEKCKAERDNGHAVTGVLKENCKTASRAQNKMVATALS